MNKRKWHSLRRTIKNKKEVNNNIIPVTSSYIQRNNSLGYIVISVIYLQ